MPELPEVEVVRRGVEKHVAGRTVAAAEVFHPRAIRRHVAGAEDFAGRLAGRVIAEPRRRGKYMWLPLADEAGNADEAMLAHLGMSGQLLVMAPGSPAEKHLRVRLTFDDGGGDLRFVDQRTFGHLMVAPLVDGVPAPISHIAADPLEPGFDEALFAAKLKARRTGIKRALLDQSLISGVGNIYADEALWRARLHWARPTETLTRPKVAELVQAVREVMTEALGQGGTSFDSLYVNVNGESGYFDRSLAAYGRRDEPCPRCGTPIRRDAFMNRSSYTCPKCQPRPRNGRF
ncbi:bifunctional DNA-formamidopyrimidine glycosylase/DNA-(apurinic or apyrimidinic site) lyase [Bailinhaonella thermotolerans]|uniref:Formamidopyrimidine-DNA glycosylase n=1 Tax=Bailinhaonella thermotolerans TaxID=1070861 RepID=A0A3A4A8W2_9ACTN|nr:bifunctional DNA-formamidopyrimidine glycosylase/DNA-(apurinic or apyrimidinic site) lyase [Bailinhaonella thermotolerans]RJL25035.1 bifunctional DNA-formamidopyrimidine glycosylase/DNA-(apurinic or apyrimidinic site) lyase [Bailinhaonella thermotolerans]